MSRLENCRLQVVLTKHFLPGICALHYSIGTDRASLNGTHFSIIARVALLYTGLLRVALSHSYTSRPNLAIYTGRPEKQRLRKGLLKKTIQMCPTPQHKATQNKSLQPSVKNRAEKEKEADVSGLWLRDTLFQKVARALRLEMNVFSVAYTYNSAI